MARAVSDNRVAPLVAAITEALHRPGKDLKAAIQAMLTAYLGWHKEFPSGLRLVRMLEEADARPELNRATGMNQRLGEVLATGLDRLGNGRVFTRVPSRLYAVLLAPAMSATPLEPVSTTDDEDDAEWMETLTRMAMTELGLAEERSQRKPSGKVPNKQQSLSPDGAPPENAQRGLDL